MNADFVASLDRSRDAFLHLIWPRVRWWVGGGHIRSVESSKDAVDLDTLAGIDAWHIDDERGMRGIASRVQYERAYTTFTVRYSRESGADTEYHKRLTALSDLDRGWLYPHLTVQGYVIGDCLHSVAMVRTRDLIADAQRQVEGGNPRLLRNPADGSRFLAVRWSDVPCKSWP